MSKTNPADWSLIWEWPANRKPEAKILIMVRAVETPAGSWLPFKKTPSIAANLPNPVLLEGEVLGGDPSHIGRSVRLTLPAAEVPGLKAGDRLAMGLVGSAVCICVHAAPPTSEPIEDWLQSWQCGR